MGYKLDEINLDSITIKISEIKQAAYDQGMNEAWEIARRIAIPACEGGLDAYAWKEIFHKSSDSMIFLAEPNVFEVKAKIEAWEKEQEEKNKFHVGDKVFCDDFPEECAVVTRIEEEDDTMFLLWEDGSTTEETIQDIFHKTGESIELLQIFKFLNNQ